MDGNVSAIFLLAVDQTHRQSWVNIMTTMYLAKGKQSTVKTKQRSSRSLITVPIGS